MLCNSYTASAVLCGLRGTYRIDIDLKRKSSSHTRADTGICIGWAFPFSPLLLFVPLPSPNCPSPSLILPPLLFSPLIAHPLKTIAPINQPANLWNALTSPSRVGRAVPRPKTNPVHSKVARKPLVAIILSILKCMFYSRTIKI